MARLRRWFTDNRYRDIAHLPGDIIATTSVVSPGTAFDTWLFVFEDLDLPMLRDQVCRARAWVNTQYWVPRLLRMRHPHVLCVALCEHMTPDLAAWIDAAPRNSWWGGEMCHIMAVDRRIGLVAHQRMRTRVDEADMETYSPVRIAGAVAARAG